MIRQSARFLLTCAYILALSLLTTACETPSDQPVTQSGTSGARITIQSESDQEELQPFEINNCDGKAEAVRTEKRAQTISVAVSKELAATLGADAQFISVQVQNAVGTAITDSLERSTEITLSAPPRTRMIFQLAWLGKEQLGIAENVHEWTIPIAFKRFVPADVRIKSQTDIGCPGSDTTSPSLTTDLSTPPSTPSVASSTLCPYEIKRSDVQSWKIGVADVSTVQAYIRQFDAMRPGDGGAYRQGITIPGGLLLATNFDENDATLWQTLPVIPIVHSGSWGLWETTGSFVAPNRGACMVIIP